MITCPVCRFDAPPKSESCPDCGTSFTDAPQDALSSDEQLDENQEKPRAKVGDLILEEFTLEEALNDDPIAPRFLASSSQNESCLVTILYDGLGTRPLVLSKARDPILKLNHPHIEKYLKVATDPHERCVIVAENTLLPSLNDVLQSASFTDKDPLPLNKIPQFLLEAGRLLELFHRRHPLPGLPIGEWRIKEHSPLVQGLMKARVDALEIPDKDQVALKLKEVADFRRLALDLEKQLQKQEAPIPEALGQIFLRLQDISDPETLTASRLLSALAIPTPPPSGRSRVLRKRQSQGYNPKSHRPHAHQQIHIDRSDIPSIASGAPNIRTQREVVKGRHFVPQSLRKERYLAVKDEQEKLSKLAGKARECHEIQLRDDLRLIHFTGWLLPFFAATNPLSLALAIPLAAIGVPLFSSLSSKKANAPGAFFSFFILGTALALILGTGAPGVLWAACLATASAIRANKAKELARENPWEKQEQIYGESLIAAKTRELNNTLKSIRFMICGSASLTLSLLPAASATTFLHASACQGMIFGALATYFGLNKVRKGQGRPRNIMAASLFIAGLLSCWSYVMTPLALIPGLIMTAVMAFGFGSFVEQSLADEEDAARLESAPQSTLQSQSTPLPIQVQSRSSTRRSPPIPPIPDDLSRAPKSAASQSQKPQKESL